MVVRSNRSFVESGDHTGNSEVEPSAPDVSSLRPVPSGCTTHTCGFARRLLVNAMSRPSGDHCAEMAPTPDGVTWRSLVPSEFTMYKAVPRPCPVRHAAANATRDPSGDQSALSSASVATTGRSAGFSRSGWLPSGLTTKSEPSSLGSNLANKIREPVPASV